jgi:hypothetical protein
MPNVTIISTVTGPHWQGGDAPTLIIESGGPFIAAGGIPANNSGGPFREEYETSVNGGGYVVVPDVTLPSTEDSSDPSATYFAYFQKANAYDSVSRIPFSVFGPGRGFRVPASPTSTTWEDIALNMGAAGPAALADRTVNNLTVVNNTEVQGTLTAPTITGDTEFTGDIDAQDITAQRVVADLSLSVGLPGSVDGTNYDTLINDGSVDIRANDDGAHPGAIVQVAHGVQILMRGYADRVEFGAPVVGVNSARKVYASVEGATLDGATEDTAAIQDLFDLATAGPVHVVIDGEALTAPLRIRGDTTLEFLPGCRLKLKDGANETLLRNANPVGSGAVTDKNITLINFTADGNYANQTGTGLYDRREPDGSLIGLIQLYGVENVRIIGGALRDSKSIALHMSNCRHVWIDDVYIDNNDPGEFQQGGIQIEGPASDIHIRNVSGTTQDDLIAFSPDGASYVEDPGGGDEVTGLGPYVAGGDITDWTVDGVTGEDAFSCVRIFAGSHRIDRGLIKTITGTFAGVLIWNDPATLVPTNIGTVIIEDVNVKMTGTPSPGTGAISLYGKAEAWILRNINFRGPSDDRALVYAAPGSDIGLLDIGDLAVYDTDPAAAGMTPVVVSGYVRRLKVPRPKFLRDPSLARAESFVKLTGTGARVDKVTFDDASLDRTLYGVYHHEGALRQFSSRGGEMEDAGGGLLLRSDVNTLREVIASGFSGRQARAFYSTVASAAVLRGDAFVRDAVAPTFTSATVNASGRLLVVTFSKPVNGPNFTDGVIIKKGGVTQTVNNAFLLPGAGNQVGYVLISSVAGGSTVTWEYDAAAGLITDWHSNPLATLAAQSVTVAANVERAFDQFVDSSTGLPYTVVTALAGRTAWPTAAANPWAFQAGSSSKQKVYGDRARLDGTGPTTEQAVFDCGQANVVVQATAMFTGPQGGAGIIFRGVDASNYWLFWMTAAGTQLFSVSAGVATLRASNTLPHVPNVYYRLTVSVTSGNVISCQVDDEATVGITNSTHATATKVGLQGYYGPAFFDDLIVVSL